MQTHPPQPPRDHRICPQTRARYYALPNASQQSPPRAAAPGGAEEVRVRGGGVGLLQGGGVHQQPLRAALFLDPNRNRNKVLLSMCLGTQQEVEVISGLPYLFLGVDKLTSVRR